MNPEAQHSADGPTAKSAGRRERTRQKILEAAFGLIGHEKGLTVRIEEICAAARISRGTFYNYFTSLEQLFEVLAIEIGHELNQALVSTFDQEFSSHAVAVDSLCDLLEHGAARTTPDDEARLRLEVLRGCGYLAYLQDKAQALGLGDGAVVHEDRQQDVVTGNVAKAGVAG